MDINSRWDYVGLFMRSKLKYQQKSCHVIMGWIPINLSAQVCDDVQNNLNCHGGIYFYFYVYFRDNNVTLLFTWLSRHGLI